MTSILFVCMANICRSPLLEATFRHLAIQKGIGEKVKVDSCGIGWFHVGQHPDPRTFEAAKKHGILIDHLSQQFRDSFLEEFDLILTVDPVIAEQIQLKAKNPEQKKKIRLVTDYSRQFKGRSIPDPYYMDGSGFDEVVAMAFDCCEGIFLAYFNRSLDKP